MSETNSTTVTVSHDGPLRYLTLTDPRRRNALSTSTMRAAPWRASVIMPAWLPVNERAS